MSFGLNQYFFYQNQNKLNAYFLKITLTYFEGNFFLILSKPNLKIRYFLYVFYNFWLYKTPNELTDWRSSTYIKKFLNLFKK